jgi:hypothetical protein
LSHLILTRVYLFTGLGKLFADEKVAKFAEGRSTTHAMGIPCEHLGLIEVAEILDVLGEVIPVHFAGFPYSYRRVWAAFGQFGCRSFFRLSAARPKWEVSLPGRLRIQRTGALIPSARLCRRALTCAARQGFNRLLTGWFGLLKQRLGQHHGGQEAT